jgi:probable HAF family extracellular repeat protein
LKAPARRWIKEFDQALRTPRAFPGICGNMHARTNSQRNRKMVIAATVATVMGSFGVAVDANAATYSFQTIAPPSAPVGDFIVVGGLNDEGQLLVSRDAPGVTYDYVDADDVYNIYTKTYTTLPDAPGATPKATEAYGINDSGEIVGFYHPAGGEYQGFSYSGGVFTTLDAFGTLDTVAFDVSNNGMIVGLAGDFTAQQGFAYSAGQYTAINGAPYPVNSTEAIAINDSGAIVGAYGPSSLDTEPNSFLYSGGVFTPVAMPGELDTGIGDINDAGLIVGGASNDGFATGPGFVDDNGAFTAVSVPGSVETFVDAINDRGQIAGTYIDADGATQIFLATPVPEPAAWAMILAGFGGLGASMRRRRRRAIAAI